MNDVVYFRYYFDKLNLPQTTVLQIEQDKRGFLWLATGHGVYRFDGNEAVPLYEIVPGYDEILKQYISWIMVDETDGLLWMSNGYVFEFETGVLRENRISTEFMQNPPLIDTQGNLWFSFFDRYMKYAPSRDVGTALEVPVGVLPSKQTLVWNFPDFGGHPHREHRQDDGAFRHKDHPAVRGGD